MKKGLLFLLVALVSLTINTSAQSLKTYRVGIFAPVYLDSVFNGKSYRYSKNFPKFVLPGLEFFQGAQIALDSMKVSGTNIHTSFYDSRSEKESISDLIRSKKLDSLDLIIGSVKDMDYQELASFSLQKNVPFISATYPNDGGVSANPFLVIMNSTLKAHCEAIHTYLLQNHGTDNIILVRKTGTQEDRVSEYFRDANTPDGKPLLNIKTVNIKENDFSILETYLDSNSNNIIVSGSLEEGFSTSLITAAAEYDEYYYVKLIGMPNWDNYTLSSKNPKPDFPVYFTSPYYNIKYDSYSKTVKEAYLKKFKGNPTDMTYKGFESVYLFVKLLAKHPYDFMSHLNDHSERVFSDFNFKPVFHNQKGASPDYFENKHLYFIKALNKTASKAW